MSKKIKILSALIMAIIMSGVLSAIMPFINWGVSNIFLIEWLKGWAITSVLAFPLSYFLPDIILNFLKKHFAR